MTQIPAPAGHAAPFCGFPRMVTRNSFSEQQMKEGSGHGLCVFPDVSTLTLHNTPSVSRWLNALQTLFLLGLMLAMGIALGRILLGPWGLALAAGLALFALVSSSSAAPRLVLSLYRARPVAPYAAPGVYRILAELALRADLPAVPRLRSRRRGHARPPRAARRARAYRRAGSRDRPRAQP